MIKFKKILVPVDFGEPSQHALELAVDLAKQYGAALTILHTWEVPAYAYSGIEYAPADLLTPVADAAREQLNGLLAVTKAELPTATAILKEGVPWREILSTIEETQADLVVVGTHGRRGIGRALLGSVAERVVRMSPVPVLTVRAKAG